jgi:hypothetical protein
MPSNRVAVLVVEVVQQQPDRASRPGASVLDDHRLVQGSQEIPLAPVPTPHWAVEVTNRADHPERLPVVPTLHLQGVIRDEPKPPCVRVGKRGDGRPARSQKESRFALDTPRPALYDASSFVQRHTSKSRAMPQDVTTRQLPVPLPVVGAR